ncbi:hypothetical protein [uncultured Rikenella sp.]|uniref:hypothetical protein n=1 Tax=uncultured Rikenella sp. TaxID=368003 RepID=UPI0026217121|nr:hypothetical protein [uncultured Rikenella sp.]
MPSGTAPGYRWAASGALHDIGHRGYSWGSTISGTFGMNLNFGTTWINSSGVNDRGWGFQLRCLSE